MAYLSSQWLIVIVEEIPPPKPLDLCVSLQIIMTFLIATLINASLAGPVSFFGRADGLHLLIGYLKVTERNWLHWTFS